MFSLYLYYNFFKEANLSKKEVLSLFCPLLFGSILPVVVYTQAINLTQTFLQEKVYSYLLPYFLFCFIYYISSFFLLPIKQRIKSVCFEKIIWKHALFFKQKQEIFLKKNFEQEFLDLAELFAQKIDQILYDLFYFFQFICTCIIFLFFNNSQVPLSLSSGFIFFCFSIIFLLRVFTLIYKKKFLFSSYASQKESTYEVVSSVYFFLKNQSSLENVKIKEKMLKKIRKIEQRSRENILLYHEYSNFYYFSIYLILFNPEFLQLVVFYFCGREEGILYLSTYLIEIFFGLHHFLFSEVEEDYMYFKKKSLEFFVFCKQKEKVRTKLSSKETFFVDTLSYSTFDTTFVIKNFELKERFLLVYGPSGLGKSLFLKSLSGEYPSKGKIFSPKNIFFLAQSIYVPIFCSFKKLLSFGVGKIDEKKFKKNLLFFSQFSDIFLKIKQRESKDWDIVLSQREKTLIYFFKISLANYLFVFLDEPFANFLVQEARAILSFFEKEVVSKFYIINHIEELNKAYPSKNFLSIVSKRFKK